MPIQELRGDHNIYRITSYNVCYTKLLRALAKVDRDKYYDPREALELAKELAFTKFDGTVEVHLRTGLDPRQADQQIRDVVVLPNGLGKTVRVLVFAQGEGAQLAREAGADIVADDDEWINKIQAGFTDFDVAIATPDMMGRITSYNVCYTKLLRSPHF